MRVVRFSPQPDAGLGSDPLYGILEEDNQISIISGDPIYHGIQKTAAKVELTKVRLLAPVIPRSKIVAVGKNSPITPLKWVGSCPMSQSSS